MKIGAHLFWQAMLTLAQYGNVAVGVTHGKTLIAVTGVLSVVQALLAWHAHYTNPDGTPASR